jgi:hypothetical protein
MERSRLKLFLVIRNPTKVMKLLALLGVEEELIASETPKKSQLVLLEFGLRKKTSLAWP